MVAVGVPAAHPQTLTLETDKTTGACPGTLQVVFSPEGAGVRAVTSLCHPAAVGFVSRSDYLYEVSLNASLFASQLCYLWQPHLLAEFQFLHS